MQPEVRDAPGDGIAYDVDKKIPSKMQPEVRDAPGDGAAFDQREQELIVDGLTAPDRSQSATPHIEGRATQPQIESPGNGERAKVGQPADFSPPTADQRNIQERDKAEPGDRPSEVKEPSREAGHERLDEKTGVRLKYDEQGRLSETATQDGRTTHFEYKGDAAQPAAVQMNDANGKPLLHIEGEFKVDKQTGEVSQTRELTDAQSGGGRIETTFSPEQTASVTRFDANGHRLSQESSQPTVDGIKILDRTNYVYTDANGNPTQDSNKIDNTKPVMTVTVDEGGRVTDRYAYATPQQVEQSKPSFHEQIKYSENPENHTKSEQRVGYDLSNGEKPLFSAQKVANTETGVTTLDTRQANGVEQHFEFDRAGKATAFSRSELDESGQKHVYDFELNEGSVAKVSKDKQEITGPQAEQVKQIGDLTVEQARQQHNVEAQIAVPKENLAPTEPREGEKPSGTLVWKDGEKLRQASVEAGQVKDGDDKAIGTVQDNGSVTLSGPPPTSFKIADSEGAAFHGIGSDKARLDLVSQKDVQGFSGTMTSPDGAQKYAVVGGNLYDSSGKMYAHLDQYGKLHFPNDNPPPTDVNSQLEGWKFRGTENGQQRLMDCAPKAPSGKLFIPDEQGKPVEYEVRMGMIVNKATNEQYGLLKAPSETADGKLIGGAITLAKNGETKELADFKHAVFDLHLNGEGGRPSRNIQGASLGHIERMADGTPKPGQGGLFNVQDALDAQKHKVDHADAKAKEQERFVNRVTGFLNKNDQVAHDREIAHVQSDQAVERLQKMIATGNASDQNLQFLQSVTREAKQAGLEDPLMAQRRKLDTDGKHLEDLPKDPKQINGSVRFPDDRYAPGDTLHVIKDGKIMGADGKTPIGTIDNASGDMTLLNPKTGQPVKTSMRDLEGSVWNLQYNDDKGSPQQATWVSLGDRGGIASVADLKEKAAGELEYAKAVNEKAGSSESQKYQDEVAKRADELNQRLDKITRDGVSIKDGDRSDLNMLADGAGKFVRPGDHKEGAPEAGQKQTPRQRIEVPELNGENINQVNGDLRVGNHVYKINNGELREVHFKDGQTTVDKEPCGKLGPNYTVSLPGQQLDLARENRVLMQFTVGNEKEPHQIIGLGPGRNSADHGYQSGGLVEGKELYRRSMEIRQEALSGNNDYFANKPWITGTALDMAGSFDEHENQLATYGDRLDQTVKEVTGQTDKLFKDGFNPETFYNNKLDTNIDLTQRLMDYIGATATTSKETASEARATQKMIADSAVMAATTVVTAGAGSFFAAASTAGKMTVGAAYAAELGTGVLAGSVISVGGRASDSSKWQDNAASGAIEGGAMAFGSVFGKAVGAINDLNHLKTLSDMKNAGAALGASELAMLETGVGKMMLQGYTQAQIKAAYYGSRVLDATVQTATMTTASAIQEKGLSYVLDHKMETLQKADIAQGTLWMLAGQAAGHGAEAMLGKVGKMGHSALTGALGETKEAQQLAQKLFGVSEQGIATRVLNDTVNSYANSGLGAMNGALEAERARIGKDLGIPPELVTGKLLREHVNQANVLSAMHEAGVSGTLTAPLLTLATHPIQGKAESLLGIQRDEHGSVIRPAEQTHLESPAASGKKGSGSGSRDSTTPRDSTAPRETTTPNEDTASPAKREPIERVTENLEEQARTAQAEQVEGRPRVYTPEIQPPTAAVLEQVNRDVPHMSKPVAENFSQRFAEVRDRFTEDLTPVLKRADELAPKVDNAHKILDAKIADLKQKGVPDSEIQAAKTNKDHPLNKESDLFNKHEDWKHQADEHAQLTSHMKEVAEQRRAQLQEELNRFTSENKLPKLDLTTVEYSHTAGGYHSGEGKITIPKVDLLAAGGGDGLSKTLFHEMVHAIGQDSDVVRLSIHETTTGGKPMDPEAVRKHYKESTGTELSQDWLDRVVAASKDKPPLTADQITRLKDLASELKTVESVGEKSKDLLDSARTIESRLKRLDANIMDDAANRLLRELTDPAGGESLQKRLFGDKPITQELLDQVDRWESSSGFDGKKTRDLLINHLEQRLNEVNTEHKAVIDAYANKRLEKEAYGLEHHVKEPTELRQSVASNQPTERAITPHDQPGKTTDAQSPPLADQAQANQGLLERLSGGISTKHDSHADWHVKVPPLEQGKWTNVGREHVPDNPDFVSGNHASVIRNSKGDLILRDNNSTNGTFIRRDGSDTFERIKTPTKVNPSDEVRLGSPSGPQLKLPHEVEPAQAKVTGQGARRAEGEGGALDRTAQAGKSAELSPNLVRSIEWNTGQVEGVRLECSLDSKTFAGHSRYLADGELLGTLRQRIDPDTGRPDSWYYLDGLKGGPASESKVHVYGTPDASTKDLGELQKVILKAIKEDPKLAGLISECKTYNPEIGFTGHNPPDGLGPQGQDAKAFTLYAANREDAILIAKKIDAVIAEHPELKLGKPFNGGNVDTILGASNRVGLCSDQWAPGSNSRTGDLRVRVDEAVNSRVMEDPTLKAYRADSSHLTEAGLRKLEEKLGLKDGLLSYDDQDRLTMAVRGKNPEKNGQVYVSEGSAEKVERGSKNANGDISKGLNDRPALYKLYENYQIDPVLGSKDVNVPPLKPGEPITLGRQHISGNPALVSPEHVQIVQNSRSGALSIRDNDSAHGTFVKRAGTESFEPIEKGKWMKIGPDDEVRLGSRTGPQLKLNQGVGPGQAPHERGTPQPEQAVKEGPNSGLSAKLQAIRERHAAAKVNAADTRPADWNEQGVRKKISEDPKEYRSRTRSHSLERLDTRKTAAEHVDDHSSTPETHPERPGAGELKRGGEVEFNGEKHTIAGFDTKSGDVVLKQQHHDDDLQVRPAPPNVEADPNFGKVKVGEHTFYHDRSDPEGKVYSVLKSPTGTDVLLLEPGYKVVGRDKLSIPADHGLPPDKPTEVFVNGKKVKLTDGEVTVGRSHQKTALIDGLHPNVSRDHLVVRQDSEGRTFIKDISRDGTFRQKEDGSWERLEKGKEVLLKPTDTVRMGSPIGPELNLKERAPEIYLNGQKIDATGNEVIIGRDHQKDVLKGLLHSAVSREHLVLRQDAQGQLFVKDTSKGGTYRQAPDGSWERLPKGQEVAVSPTDVLRLGSKDGAELCLSERPTVTDKAPLPVPSPAVEQPMKAGSKVEFEGNKYFVSGFDKNTGDVILCRPGHGADFAARPRELTPEFTPVNVGKETFYRNPEGAMFKLKGPEGQQMLVQDHEMKIVPRDRITEIARLKAEAPPPGEVRPLTPEQLRRRNDGEYLTMFFRRETAAEPEAVRQSNQMARKHQISDKLVDGFQLCTSEGVGIGGDGRTRQKHSPDIVLDRTQDKILNRYIAEAHRQFDHLKNDPQALAAELTKFAKKVMHPDGWTEKKLDDAYGEFNKEFAGKRMLLGEVINRSQKGEYGGVCAQQAMLLKVLGDNFGLETRLVYGHYKETKTLPPNPSCNHAWTEMKIDGKWLIFDPRQRRNGQPLDGHPTHFHLADRSQVLNAHDLVPVKDKQAKPKSGEQAEHERTVPAESRAPEHSRPASGGKPEIPTDLGLRIELNDKVRFLDKDGWKVTGFNEKTGNLIVTGDNTRTMSAKDFVALNPNQRYTPGQEYTGRDLMTGKPESGWTLVGKDKDGNALLVKKDGLTVEASPNEIAKENPGLIQPKTIVLDSLDRSQNKLQDGQLSLDKVLLGTVGSRNPISEGKVTHADGSTTDVIVHRFGGEGDSAQRSAERMRKELAAYKLNQLLGFDNGYPPTAPIGKDQVVTHKGQPQDGVEGWIQKKNGDQFEREMQNLAHQKLGRHGHQAVSELVKGDPHLRKQVEQAFVERLIYGDRDSLSTNFVVVNENGQTMVRNIDLQEAFGQHRVPDWQALPKHGINERLHRDFSDKPLSSDVREQIQKFVETWNTEAGRKELADSLNLSTTEVGAMLTRAEWLAEKGRFPRAETQKQLLEKAAAQKKLEENKTLYGRFKNAVKKWLGRDD
jgi:YD repeat-containing protein